MKCQLCPTVDTREAVIHAWVILNPKSQLAMQFARPCHLCAACAHDNDILRVISRGELSIPQTHMAEVAKRSMMRPSKAQAEMLSKPLDDTYLGCSGPGATVPHTMNKRVG